MKYIPAGLSRKVGRALLHTQKHSPTLLFAAGVVGVVTTVVLASKATLRLEETLEKTNEDLKTAKDLFESAHKDYSNKDFRQDQVTIMTRGIGSVVKLYGPSLIVGVISIGCLTSSHRILSNRNVALTAAYAGLEKGFNEYRNRVREEFGEDKERELRYGTKTTEVTDLKGTTLVKTVSDTEPSVYAKFFDEYCKNWNKDPEYNMFFLKCTQNWANDMLKSRGHVFLNEVYDMLGLDRTKAGAVVGWVYGDSGDDFIDFGLYADSEAGRAFANGRERSVLLDFNVDGVIFDKLSLH